MLSSGRASPATAAATADVTQHLSAQERMHVSRVTGAPLVSLTNNPRHAPHQRQPSYGLIGAIEAREKEKLAIKKGGNTVAVQMAIDAHHRHAQAQQQRSERARVAEREQAQAMAAAQQAFLLQQQQQQMAAQGGFMGQQGYGGPGPFYPQQQAYGVQPFQPQQPAYGMAMQPQMQGPMQMGVPMPMQQMGRQPDRPLTRGEADELQQRARALNQARGMPHTGGPAARRMI